MESAIRDYRAASDNEQYDRRAESNTAVDYIQERVIYTKQAHIEMSFIADMLRHR